VYLAALILANVIVRGLPVPFWVATAEALMRGAAYGLAFLTLLRPSIAFDPSLSSVRDLCLLLIVAVIASAVTACAYIALLLATELLPAQDISAGLLRCWVGDMIGVAVITPFGLLATSREFLKPRWEVAVLMGSSIALTMWVAVVFAEFDQLQLFYLLFLPLTWIAVRSGIEGVSAALVLIQVGLVIALLFITGRTVDVLDFQARMLVLAVTGLVAGVLVSERRLAEARLRMNQNALSHLSRLGSMGELAVLWRSPCKRRTCETRPRSRWPTRRPCRSAGRPTTFDALGLSFARAAATWCRQASLASSRRRLILRGRTSSR
jgi:integral membrane sensor domain MASE1